MIKVNEKMMFSLSEIREESARFRRNASGDSARKGVYFDSMKAMLRGAFRFVSAFGEWHSRGLVYGSSDPSRFHFDLNSGEMFFNGEDYLAKPGQPVDPGQVMVNEFLPPETVLYVKSCRDQDKEDQVEEILQETWNLETDWYFMSVFLFEYFFHTGSPFEGKTMVNHCFLSPLEEENYRASEGIFCMEPGDHGNNPVPGIQDKLIRYWKEYPERLQKTFQRAFLSGGMLTNLRPTELDWKQTLVWMMMDYKTCSCGFHGFSYRLNVKENGVCTCPGCGKVYYPLSDGLDRILLSEGEKLYECQTGLEPNDYETVTGRVVENKRKKGLFGIRNVSDGYWRGFYPDGTTREIHHGQVIPIWEGMTLAFERGENWTLRVASSAVPGMEEPEVIESPAENPVENPMESSMENSVDEAVESSIREEDDFQTEETSQETGSYRVGTEETQDKDERNSLGKDCGNEYTDDRSDDGRS